MARIVGGNEAAEVHLDYAIERLEEAVEASGLDVDNTPRVSGTPTADMEHVSAALAHMKNADLHWDDWVRIGMAAYAASGGSQDGLDAWCEWSAKSNKHEDQGVCRSVGRILPGRPHSASAQARSSSRRAARGG